jgi:5-oxoprolinase (ATP-hydrolysing)
MPLNQGVLDPITNIVPAGSFLNPSGEVAIAGSTISSQRLVDVILQAFKAAACSQGCASSTGFGEFHAGSLRRLDLQQSICPGWTRVRVEKLGADLAGSGGKDAFGKVTPGFTYGESIGGGSGAGPGWHGKHATCVVSSTSVLSHRSSENPRPNAPLPQLSPFQFRKSLHTAVAAHIRPLKPLDTRLTRSTPPTPASPT